LTRTVLQCAVAVLLAVSSLHLQAESVSTHCLEREVALDSAHSVARLERCGDDVAGHLLWHLDRIDQIGSTLDGRFDRRNSGAGSVIYVMDTGVKASHSEFASSAGTRVIAGFDAASGVGLGRSRCTTSDRATAPCYDGFEELASASHGTSVASVAAGRQIGVAPEAFIVSVRVMNERGLATTRTYMDGLDAIIAHAWSQDAPRFRTAVVNISGWVLERLNETNPPIHSVVSFGELERKMRAMIAGVNAAGQPDPEGRRFLFVVAANNVDGGCGPAGLVDRFPALLGSRTPGLITVGGMTVDNMSWTGSCRGGVEVLAPAQSIFSATITADDHYRGKRPNLRSGTSFAAPIISGIAARLLADRPDLSPEQLESWITATPSRVWNPTATLADGKVAYVRSIGPPVSSQAARLDAARDDWFVMPR
jgi:subtilisin family serine protease